jgi:hypothetical protein
MLNALVERRSEVWRFHGVLSALRVAAIDALLGDGRKCLDAEDLFHAARLMTGAAAMRVQARQHADIEEVQRILNRIATRLSACNDLDSLRAALDETLPGFGLRQAFLLTISNVPPNATVRARLCHALGTDLEATDELPFDVHELLPANVWERTRRTALGAQWVILPLFSRRLVLGFALVELLEQSGADYETLRIHLSTAFANALHSLDIPPLSSPPATVRSRGD